MGRHQRGSRGPCTTETGLKDHHSCESESDEVTEIVAVDDDEGAGPAEDPQPKVKPTPSDASGRQTQKGYAKPKPKKRPKILDTEKTETGRSPTEAEPQVENIKSDHPEQQPASPAETRPLVPKAAPRPRDLPDSKMEENREKDSTPADDAVFRDVVEPQTSRPETQATTEAGIPPWAQRMLHRRAKDRATRRATKKSKGPSRPTKKPQWLLPMEDDYDLGRRDNRKDAVKAPSGSKSRRHCTEQSAKSGSGSSTRYKRDLPALSSRAGPNCALCSCLSLLALRLSLAPLCDSSLDLGTPETDFRELRRHCILGGLPPPHPPYLLRSNQLQPPHPAQLSLCHRPSAQTQSATTADPRPWSIDHYDAKTQAGILAGLPLSFPSSNSVGCLPEIRTSPRSTYCHQHSSRALSLSSVCGLSHSPLCSTTRCVCNTGSRQAQRRHEMNPTACEQQGWQDCYQDPDCCAVCNRTAGRAALPIIQSYSDNRSGWHDPLLIARGSVNAREACVLPFASSGNTRPPVTGQRLDRADTASSDDAVEETTVPSKVEASPQLSTPNLVPSSWYQGVSAAWHQLQDAEILYIMHIKNGPASTAGLWCDSHVLPVQPWLPILSGTA